MDALFTELKEFFLARSDQRVFVGGPGGAFLEGKDVGSVLEVSLGRHSVDLRETSELLGRKRLLEFFLLPDIKFSFLAFRIRVLSGKKTSLRMGHVTEDIVQDLSADLGKD